MEEDVDKHHLNFPIEVSNEQETNLTSQKVEKEEEAYEEPQIAVPRGRISCIYIF